MRVVWSVCVLLVLSVAVWAALLDFDLLTPGTIVDDMDGVKVFGYNPDFGPGTNAAVVFDSSDPTGGDIDLGTPNEAYGGPGIGTGGAISNKTALGNLLIIAEDLVDSNSDGYVDDPDDADLHGAYFEFDFSGLAKGKKGVVTVNSVTLVDIERDEGETGTFVELFGPGLPVNLISIPNTGDNGVVTIDGINLAGVNLMRVTMNGSGALESVLYDQEEKGHCWFTFGGFQNAGIQSGGKDFTFGGNVGPPSSGSIEVVDHNTGDNFHTNNVWITKCETITGTGPGQPGGKKGFTTNKAYFEGTGRLNHVDGYPLTGYVIDRGEPSGKKSNQTDYFEIVVRDPDTNAVVFEASGELDGGNVQIHPPVGN